MTFRIVSPAVRQPDTMPVSRRRAGRPAVRLAGSISISITRLFAGSRIRTLESYAYDLLHFLRWWESVHHTDAIVKEALTESTLLDYVRFQSSQQPEVTGGTINQRVAIVDQALRIVFPDAPGQIAPGFQQTYLAACPMGLGRPRLALSRLRVKTPKRIISPLSVDEVARFWSSFRTSRDLAIVGLMLLQGLRSQEVLDLNRDDLLLPEAQIRVRGKGNKTPLPAAGSGSGSVARSLSAAGAAHHLDRRLVCFSERPCSRRPDDTRGFTLTVSPSSPDHWRQNRQPAPFPPYLRLGYGPCRR